MNGSEVIEALKKKFREDTDKALKPKIGISGQSIQDWKNRPNIPPLQVAGLVHKASLAGARNSETNPIQPVVEFFQIQKRRSPYKAKYQIFDEIVANKENKYLKGLKTKLDSNYGVYLFFDSRGQAIYAGRARKQTLWKEVNLAFNRARGEVQKIKRVIHPKRSQEYKTSDEKARQIVGQAVSLHELAHYLSAYAVRDGLIDKVEAMLVRSFANDLLNIRMENFVKRHKPKSA